MKFLYRTSEAKDALGIGETKLYQLINAGVLEIRRNGRRILITADSLEAYVASLPPAMTPTMAREQHEKRGSRKTRPKPYENEVGATE